MSFRRKKKLLSELSLIIFGLLFHTVSGKLCPETIRPHNTRCDKYFRCVVLSSKSYVWVPMQCERGLVFKPELKTCVVPDNDWDCNLDNETDYVENSDDKNVYGINNIPTMDYKRLSVDVVDDELSDSDNNNQTSDKININSELNENHQIVTETAPNSKFTTVQNSYDNNDEFSGDGPISAIEIKLEDKSNNLVSIPESIDFDNSLTAHLQRLSQLVDSVRRQKNANSTQNLAADELNAFLANYNIQTGQYATTDFHGPDKSSLTDDGHIHPEHLAEIINKQSTLTIRDVLSTLSTEKPFIMTTPMSTTSLFPSRMPNVKLELKSESPFMKKSRQPEIHSSQIIVNRPGGSVVFSLEPNQRLQAYQPVHNEPYISEDTLRTVLELSKQMVQNQHLQQMYPQPIVKPVYYSVPIPVMTNYNQPQYSQYNDDASNNEDNANVNSVNEFITGFMNNRPLRRKPSSAHIPISVSNSFNTYKDYDTDPSKGAATQPQNMYPGNNISTTVIFDRTGLNTMPQQMNQYPATTTTTTTQPPPFYDTYGQLANQNYNLDYNHRYDSVYPSNYQTPPPFESYNSYGSDSLYNNNNNNQYSNTGGQQIHTNFQSYQNPQSFNQQPPNQQQTYNQFYNQQQQQQQVSGPIYNLPALPLNQNQMTNIQQPPPQPLTVSPMMDDDNDDDDDDDNEATTFKPLAPPKKRVHKRPIPNNNDNTASQSTQFLPLSSYLTSAAGDASAEEYTKNKLINIGGNFVNYDNFKNTLFPYFQPENVEIISCVSSARQPNTTDCTRYYVCNPKTKNVLGYTCPPFTAFNKEAKLCDGRTYAFCKPEAIANRFTVAENIRAQIEAQKLINDVNRLQAESLKTQALSQVLRLKAQQQQQAQNQFDNEDLSSYGLSSTVRPNYGTTMKTRRIRCFDTGKISDPDSTYHYWACFKGKDGRMKRQKMRCTGGLVFCASKRLCTTQTRCDNK